MTPRPCESLLSAPVRVARLLHRTTRPDHAETIARQNRTATEEWRHDDRGGAPTSAAKREVSREGGHRDMPYLWPRQGVAGDRNGCDSLVSATIAGGVSDSRQRGTPDR